MSIFLCIVFDEEDWREKNEEENELNKHLMENASTSPAVNISILSVETNDQIVSGISASLSEICNSQLLDLKRKSEELNIANCTLANFRELSHEFCKIYNFHKMFV